MDLENFGNYVGFGLSISGLDPEVQAAGCSTGLILC